MALGKRLKPQGFPGVLFSFMFVGVALISLFFICFFFELLAQGLPRRPQGGGSTKKAEEEHVINVHDELNLSCSCSLLLLSLLCVVTHVFVFVSVLSQSRVFRLYVFFFMSLYRWGGVFKINGFGRFTQPN